MWNVNPITTTTDSVEKQAAAVGKRRLLLTRDGGSLWNGWYAPDGIGSDGETRGGLGTVRNAVLLLRLLGEAPAYVSLRELSETAGMATPTAHRLLRSLVIGGLVQQDPRTSRYSLGPELMRLSERHLARMPVLRVLAPYLAELRDQTKATVLVALLLGDSVLYAARVDGED